MPRNYPRSDRVEELAREVLSEAVREMKDPRVGFVTITGVKLEKDMRVAHVYVSTMGTESERNNTISALQHAKAHLRSILGREIRLRRLPELRLVEDHTAESSQRIEMILKGLGVSDSPDSPTLADKYNQPDDGESQ